MIEKETPFSAGTVAYISAKRPNYDQFYDCLEQLVVPKGTALVKSANYNAAKNRNNAIEEMEGDWIWFLDDDHAFEPTALLRLLQRNADIVTPLYCRRYPPFASVVYKRFDPSKPDAIEVYPWEELSARTGLVEIEACGAGGLLVRKKVFEAMAKPWFKVGHGNGGEWRNTIADEINEDTGFIWAARNLGFKAYVDLDVSFGHLVDAALVPYRQADGSLSVFANIDGCKVWLFKGETEKKIVIAA